MCLSCGGVEGSVEYGDPVHVFAMWRVCAEHGNLSMCLHVDGKEVLKKDSQVERRGSGHWA